MLVIVKKILPVTLGDINGQHFTFCYLGHSDLNSHFKNLNPIAHGILSFSQLGGGGISGPHPRKHSKDSLIDSKFGTANDWHKTKKV